MKPQILGYYLRNEIRTGGHKRYLELLNTLAINGWDVTVILGNTIDYTNFKFNTIPIKPVYKGRVPFSIKQLLRILPILHKIKNKNKNWITISFGETNYLTMKAAKRVLKAKTIFAFRSNTYKAKIDELEAYKREITIKDSIKLKKILIIEQKISNISDQLIFQTEFDRDNIRSRTNFPTSKSTIIPNSVLESWFVDKYKLLNKSTKLSRILYLGSYDNRKGALFIIKAIEKLKKEGITLKLDMFGYGSEKKELVSYIDNNDLIDSININDKMNDPLSKIYEYDLLVVPSIYDSYPNVILESIFTGTPVIASNNSGMKAILEYDKLLFKTGDYNDIALKIKKLYDNNTSYLEIKKLCTERLHAHNFIWTSRFEDVIKNI